MVIGAKPILWLGAGASCRADPPLDTVVRAAGGTSLRRTTVTLPDSSDNTEMSGCFQPGSTQYVEDAGR